MRAKSGQLSGRNLAPGLAWTALFLSLMVPSFPLWGYWVMYCSFKPSLRLPPNDHSQPPLCEGDGFSLFHTDCLLWPVPSSGPKGQPKGSASFPRIKKWHQFQTTPLFFCFFWAYLFPFQIFVGNFIVVLCCTKCGDICLKSQRICKGLFFRDCRPEQFSTVTVAAHCSVPLWLPLLHYCIHLTLWLPDKQMQSKLSRNKCIVFLFTSGGCGDNKEKKKTFL